MKIAIIGDENKHGGGSYHQSLKTYKILFISLPFENAKPTGWALSLVNLSDWYRVIRTNSDAQEVGLITYQRTYQRNH